MREPCAMKVASTVLMGGKQEIVYLSNSQVSANSQEDV